jgi:hypothetical protein
MDEKTAAVQAAGVSIDEGLIARRASGDRIQLAFSAPCKRLVDGGYELSNVYALLHGKDGRLVVRRSAEWGKYVLTNRASWVHEFLPEQISAAATLSYEIDYRFDYRRTIVAGELPVLPAEADGSDWWRWVEPDPRTMTDGCVRVDLGIFARASAIDVWVVQHPLFSFDSVRSELEFEMTDADGFTVQSRNFSVSSSGSNPGYSDFSPSIERRALRNLRFFALRGRTEARMLLRLGPYDLR